MGKQTMIPDAMFGGMSLHSDTEQQDTEIVDAAAMNKKIGRGKKMGKKKSHNNNKKNHNTNEEEIEDTDVQLNEEEQQQQQQQESGNKKSKATKGKKGNRKGKRGDETSEEEKEEEKEDEDDEEEEITVQTKQSANTKGTSTKANAKGNKKMNTKIQEEEKEQNGSDHEQEKNSKSVGGVAKKAKGKKKGKGKQQLGDWGDDSDDDSKFDLKSPSAADEDEIIKPKGKQEETNDSKIPAPKAKAKGKKKGKASKQLGDWGDDSDQDHNEDPAQAQHVKQENNTETAIATETAKSQEKESKKKANKKQTLEVEDQGSDQEQEIVSPAKPKGRGKKKAKSNPFDELDLDDISGEEDEDNKKNNTAHAHEEATMKEEAEPVETAVDAPSNDPEEEIDFGKKPKKVRDKDKKTREQKKAEKAMLKEKIASDKKKVLLGETIEDEKVEDSSQRAYGNSRHTRSNAAAYSYASGQMIHETIADAIAVTGQLLSPPQSRSLQIEKLTLQAYGKQLLKDSTLALHPGRRYGVLAPNGTGKSTLLHAIAAGLLPCPPALSLYLLDREYLPTPLTSVEAVLDIINRERIALENEMGDLLDNPTLHALRLDAIQTRLSELENDNAPHVAESILRGLGFTDELIARKTEDLSGGWRMRIALARILFVKPTLMLLDEPTNHLDLEAVVWLEEYLLTNCADHTLVIISHSQDTLNEVCTDIIHIYQQKLDYYQGNYETFLKVRAEKDALLSSRARKEDKKMAALKANLGMTGSTAQDAAKRGLKALIKQGEKDKEKDKTLQEEIQTTKNLEIKFADCGGGIPSPAIKFRDVFFGYSEEKIILKEMNFGIDLKSRIALVGPNGAGKTTLLKLLLGRLKPNQGEISHHQGLRVAHFHQHMSDQLDMDASAVGWLRRQFGDKGMNDGDMRGFIGRYGLTGKSQVIPMRQLSDGQRRRVLFAWLGLKQPHILCMDEPTNALDIDTIDSLADAINNFDGGVVLISHDLRLIEQVAEEVWMVEGGEVIQFEGDIREYKAMIKERIRKERLEAEAK